MGFGSTVPFPEEFLISDPVPVEYLPVSPIITLMHTGKKISTDKNTNGQVLHHQRPGTSVCSDLSFSDPGSCSMLIVNYS